MDNLDKMNKEIVDKAIINEEANNEVKEDALEDANKEENKETSINLDKETQTTENLDDNKVEEADDSVSDVVKQAEAVNKALKEELEALKSRTSNVFEENENLKVELEEQKKLDGMARENAEIKAQLEAFKRSAIVDGLIATGKINENLRGWTDSLSFEQIEEFSKHAPKVKTILDQENDSTTITDEDMENWKKEQQKSRIL